MTELAQTFDKLLAALEDLKTQIAIQEADDILCSVRNLFVAQPYNNGYERFLEGSKNLFDEAAAPVVVLDKSQLIILEVGESDTRHLFEEMSLLTPYGKMEVYPEPFDKQYHTLAEEVYGIVVWPTGVGTELDIEKFLIGWIGVYDNVGDRIDKMGVLSFVSWVSIRHKYGGREVKAMIKGPKGTGSQSFHDSMVWGVKEVLARIKEGIGVIELVLKLVPYNEVIDTYDRKSDVVIDCVFTEDSREMVQISACWAKIRNWYQSYISKDNDVFKGGGKSNWEHICEQMNIVFQRIWNPGIASLQAQHGLLELGLELQRDNLEVKVFLEESGEVNKVTSMEIQLINGYSVPKKLRIGSGIKRGTINSTLLLNSMVLGGRVSPDKLEVIYMVRNVGNFLNARWSADAYNLGCYSSAKFPKVVMAKHDVKPGKVVKVRVAASVKFIYLQLPYKVQKLTREKARLLFLECMDLILSKRPLNYYGEWDKLKGVRLFCLLGGSKQIKEKAVLIFKQSKKRAIQQKFGKFEYPRRAEGNAIVQVNWCVHIQMESNGQIKTYPAMVIKWVIRSRYVSRWAQVGCLTLITANVLWNNKLEALLKTQKDCDAGKDSILKINRYSRHRCSTYIPTQAPQVKLRYDFIHESSRSYVTEIGNEIFYGNFANWNEPPKLVESAEFFGVLPFSFNNGVYANWVVVQNACLEEGKIKEQFDVELLDFTKWERSSLMNDKLPFMGGELDCALWSYFNSTSEGYCWVELRDGDGMAAKVGLSIHSGVGNGYWYIGLMIKKGCQTLVEEVKEPISATIIYFIHIQLCAEKLKRLTSPVYVYDNVIVVIGISMAASKAYSYGSIRVGTVAYKLEIVSGKLLRKVWAPGWDIIVFDPFHVDLTRITKLSSELDQSMVGKEQQQFKSKNRDEDLKLKQGDHRDMIMCNTLIEKTSRKIGKMDSEMNMKVITSHSVLQAHGIKNKLKKTHCFEDKVKLESFANSSGYLKSKSHHLPCQGSKPDINCANGQWDSTQLLFNGGIGKMFLNSILKSIFLYHPCEGSILPWFLEGYDLLVMVDIAIWGGAYKLQGADAKRQWLGEINLCSQSLRTSFILRGVVCQEIGYDTGSKLSFTILSDTVPFDSRYYLMESVCEARAFIFLTLSSWSGPGEPFAERRTCWHRGAATKTWWGDGISINGQH